MRLTPIWLVVPFGVSLLAAPAHAGPNAGAGIVLHVIGEASGATLPAPPMPVDPDAIRTEIREAGTYDVALYVVGPSREMGLAGIEFDLAFDRIPLSGLDLESWEWLGDYQFTFYGWPQPGGWVTVTWNSLRTCPTEPVLPVALFRVTVYGPDQLRVIAAPRSAAVEVASCIQDPYPDVYVDEIPDGQIGWIGCLGMAGSVPGIPDQTPAAVRAVTFGGLKTRYR